MNILALDMSTVQTNVALISGGCCVRETSWMENRRGEQPLFEAVPILMRESGMTWNELDCYIAGRGPGLYSGLRTGITVMQALALPADQDVFFLNSGTAVAAQCFAVMSTDQVVVTGDARRGMLWYGLFTRQSYGPQLSGEWRLATWETFDALVPSGIPRVSSAWSGFNQCVEFSRLNTGSWVEEDVYPKARVLAECAEKMIQRGMESEPAMPVYMHPPVA